MIEGGYLKHASPKGVPVHADGCRVDDEGQQQRQEEVWLNVLRQAMMRNLI